MVTHDVSTISTMFDKQVSGTDERPSAHKDMGHKAMIELKLKSLMMSIPASEEEQIKNRLRVCKAMTALTYAKSSTSRDRRTV